MDFNRALTLGSLCFTFLCAIDLIYRFSNSRLHEYQQILCHTISNEVALCVSLRLTQIFCLIFPAQLFYTFIYISLYYLYFIWYVNNYGKKDEDFPIKSNRDFFPGTIQGQVSIMINVKRLESCIIASLYSIGVQYVAIHSIFNCNPKTLSFVTAMLLNKHADSKLSVFEVEFQLL